MLNGLVMCAVCMDLWTVLCLLPLLICYSIVLKYLQSCTSLSVFTKLVFAGYIEQHDYILVFMDFVILGSSSLRMVQLFTVRKLILITTFAFL